MRRVNTVFELTMSRVEQDPKRQRRQVAREAKLEAQRRRETQRRRRALVIYAGLALVGVAVIGLIARSATRPQPGERVAGQGSSHIGSGQSHPAYNSNPPTSGWHVPQTVSWGSLRSEVPDEVVLHNLEHGGVWISYKNPGDTVLVEKLEALASRYRSKVLITLRSKNDSPIAIAAWERLLKLETYDEQRIVEFINAYRNRGPERVPD